MEHKNQYKSMSAMDVLKCARNKNLMLPDIQRDYVWSTEDIETLFESITDNYPIGVCIFWVADQITINSEHPKLYCFKDYYDQTNNEYVRAPEVFSDQCDYYIVLDGQQRIFSLNIALFGYYRYFRGGRGHSRQNKKNFLKKELYYNLKTYDYNTEEKEDKQQKRFTFLTEAEAQRKTQQFYRVKNIIAYNGDETNILRDDLLNKKVNERAIADLCNLHRRLFDSSSDGLIHYYSIEEKDFDKVLDIFVRVNSTGKKLLKSDLLFSTLISGWSDGREKIDNIIKRINKIGAMDGKGNEYSFSREYIMRLALVLADANTNLKINSMTEDIVNKIQNNWDRIESTLEDMVCLLYKIGMSGEVITSYNATIPLAYYIYKGGRFDDAGAKNEARKYMAVSMLNGLFGTASNNVLQQTRNVLRCIDCSKTDFSLKLFQNIELTGNRRFEISEDIVDMWLDKFEKGKYTYILLTLLNSNTNDKIGAYQQDHCHPYSAFERKNIKNLELPDHTIITDQKIEEWQRKRNLIPNLQLLVGNSEYEKNENQIKNNKPLKTWINEGNVLQFCPENISLDLNAFDLFYCERRKLIRKELLHVFGLLPKDEN